MLRFLAVVLTFLLTTTSALAKFGKDPEIKDGKVTGSVLVGYSTTTVANADVKTIIAAPRLTIDYRALEAMKVWVDVPMSHISIGFDDDAGQSSFQLANLAFGARYVTRINRTIVIRTGGGLAVPTATLPDPGLNEEYVTAIAAHAGTMVAHGLWEYWKYMPDNLSIVSDTRLVIRTGLFRMTLNLDIAASIYTGDANVTDNVGVGVQLGFTAGFRNKVVEAGIGARAVLFMLGTDTNDQFQASVGPFFRAFVMGGFIEARWNLNIDDPGGFSFDDGRYWGLEIGLGAYL